MTEHEKKENATEHKPESSEHKTEHKEHTHHSSSHHEHKEVHHKKPVKAKKSTVWKPGSVEYLENNIKIDKLLCPGNNIQLGNSSSFSNNHIEALHILKNFNLTGRKIITPLNYGNLRYGNITQRIGSKLFKDEFHPLTKSLERNEYVSYMNSCGFIIMNHYRQQGLGNITLGMLRVCPLVI